MVVVVEEHHEVLPYWMHFVGSKDVSLVHVDGHEDTAPPAVVHGLDVRGAGMSSNDVFVVAAVATGKIKDVTWVWPSWDVWGRRHGEGNWSAYNRGDFLTRVGRLTYASQVWRTLTTMCLCLYFQNGTLYACELGDDSLSEHLGWISGAEDANDVYVWIQKHCQFDTSFRSRNVADTLFAQQGALEKSDNAMLLDIDLDFFGCTGLAEAEQALGTLPLELVGLALQSLVQFHFATVKDEMAVNDLLRDDISQAWKHCWLAKTRTSCGDSETYSPLSARTRNYFQSSLKFFNETAFRLLGVSLYRIIISHPNAAHVLNALGFCLYTTPSTYRSPTGNFEGDIEGQGLPRGLKLCGHFPHFLRDEQVHNDNGPVTRAVSLSPLDVKRRLAIFDKTLDQLVKRSPRPLLVTICRSIRDGYTNTATWEQVERGVFESLYRAYGTLDIVYDGNLLGGHTGWTRHTAPLTL